MRDDPCSIYKAQKELEMELNDLEITKCVCCGATDLSKSKEDFIFVEFMGGGRWYCIDCNDEGEDAA